MHVGYDIKIFLLTFFTTVALVREMARKCAVNSVIGGVTPTHGSLENAFGTDTKLCEKDQERFSALKLISLP